MIPSQSKEEKKLFIKDNNDDDNDKNDNITINTDITTTDSTPLMITTKTSIIPYMFIIDIDATIIISKKQIPGSSQALNLMNEHNIPFLFLTNNTAKSQQVKANQLNQRLKGLNTKITPDQIILNYTPIKDKCYFKQYKKPKQVGSGSGSGSGSVKTTNTTPSDKQTADKSNPTPTQSKISLLIGRKQRLQQILPLEFLCNKYITVQEYAMIFPESIPLSSVDSTKTKQTLQKQRQQLKQKIKERIGCDKNFVISRESIQSIIQQIIIMSCPNRWQQSIQIVMDVLNPLQSTKKGKYEQLSVSCEGDHEPIPVISLFDDLFLMTSQHPLPRLMIQPFTQALKRTYQLLYHGEKLDLITYGKPTEKVCKYTQKHAKEYLKSKQRNQANMKKDQTQLPLSQPHQSIQIKKFVMIGDNVDTDIKGAYNNGWQSIFVKSGAIKQDCKYATYNADNILDGVTTYIKENQIQKSSF